MTDRTPLRLIVCAAAMVAALMAGGGVQAQSAQDSVAEKPAEETGETEDSRETDFNEENFRRSMELRDQDRQRSPALIDGTYSSGSGIKMLDDLPESSQKHLREELREVIVENGPWTPEQADEIYPYEPSAAAMKNGELEKREQVAWQELVAKYHEREGAIRESAGRSQSATAGAMDQAGSEGTEEASRDAARAMALQQALESGAGAGGASGEYPQQPPTEGVSQNALELLMQRQQVPDSEAAIAQRESAQVSAQEARQQSETDANRSDEAEINLDSEGVIAIGDLEKVDLDTSDSEEQ